jgi:Radical SAM superfamily
VRVLLVSTYELGHQPLHVASPAGLLTRAGHEVKCLDLSAEAVACSVPMHTACRLALAACTQIRSLNPLVPVCLYGLYAQLATTAATVSLPDLSVAGEYEPRLLRWVSELEDHPTGNGSTGIGSTGIGSTGIGSTGIGSTGIGPPGEPGGGTRAVVELGRGHFGLPARHLLPPLDRYARLSTSNELRLAGYVEASHGCAHRCRHCPVPVVYAGRTRLVGIDAVLEDIAQLVDMGARHITFGDPDFLNGPHHALRVVSAVHEEFGDLTFDVTAKVEHILAQRDLWPLFAAAGCVFVVSAFESASDVILGHLAKGHDAAQEMDAVAVLRAAGIEPRPSFLPFTPWTGPRDVIELLDLVAACDLVGNVDPVQYSIRLLVPPGSLLLASGSLDGLLGPYDAEHLGWTWRSAEPRLDLLAESLARLAESAGAEGWSAEQAYEATRAETFRVLGTPAKPAPKIEARLRSAIARDERPRLTESWFCCAEPTESQLRTASGGDGAPPSGGGRGRGPVRVAEGAEDAASGGDGAPPSGGGRGRGPVRVAEGSPHRLGLDAPVGAATQ